MVKGDRDIPVAPNNVPPGGCPGNYRSIEECSGSVGSTVCEEFCNKTLIERTRRQEAAAQSQRQVISLYETCGSLFPGQEGAEYRRLAKRARSFIDEETGTLKSST